VSLSATAGQRRLVAGLLTAGLAVGLLAGLGRGLVSCERAAPPDPTRPLSVAEAERLASMRLHNWRDGTAALRATIGTGGAEIDLSGWVDWRRPLVYLTVTGPGAAAVTGPGTGLLQAVPGVVALRTAPAPAVTGTDPAATTDPPAPTDPPAATAPAATTSPAATRAVDPQPLPPARPPGDGWRVRRMAPGSGGGPTGSIDALLALLFTISSDRADAATALRDSPARWLRRDRTAGYEVDVLLGPAVPPASAPPTPAGGPTGARPDPATSLAAMGGAVRYWLDGQARLHRLEALLAPGTPVVLDLERGAAGAPRAIDLLGGDAVDPRRVTRAEAEALSALRQRNQAAGGAEVSLTLPTEDGGMLRAAGWVDWNHTVAYLAVHDLDRSGDGRLARADGAGVAIRPSAPPHRDGADAPPVLPPLPPPAGDWRFWPWAQRGDERGGFDLDLLVNEVLALSGWQRDEPAALRERAVWLRRDAIGEVPVAVYELPRAAEEDARPGTARMRYWVDGTGALLRLEIRTRSGGLGRLDLAPGPVPYLPPVINPG
jgi:hypothetical protein